MKSAMLWAISEQAVHAHFSPPCVAFSSSRRGRETEAEVELGVRLLTWSVEFAVRHGFASYSVENVAVDAVKRLFQRLKEAHPGAFDYLELKAERLGAACERARLVGGSPGLVARLKALPELEPSQLRPGTLVHFGALWCTLVRLFQTPPHL